MRSHFIRQPAMTPRVRPRVQAAWNGVVFLAPAHREVLPRLCSEAAWHRCFAKYAEVGEDGEGMRDEWGLKKENKEKEIPQVVLSVFLPPVWWPRSYWL